MDLAAIKEDVNLLANLCQLDEIRKDSRLRKLCPTGIGLKGDEKK